MPIRSTAIRCKSRPRSASCCRCRTWTPGTSAPSRPAAPRSCRPPTCSGATATASSRTHSGSSGRSTGRSRSDFRSGGRYDRRRMSEIKIAPLQLSPQVRGALTEIRGEAVANGASVHFMHPLAPEVADAFWEGALSAAARGERIVLGAFDDEILVGTVTLVLDTPPNQQHRAEIAKLMTRVSHRGRGVARALMRAAEQAAVGRARTLLVLDTAAEDGAGTLYEELGYRLAGEIPDSALKPRGRLTATMIYWKRLRASSRPAGK